MNHSTRNISAPCFRLDFLAAFAGALLLSLPARAVPIEPGWYRLIYGTTSAADPSLAGVVAADSLVPFAMKDANSTLRATGQVQVRVVRENASGTLTFYYRIYNDSSSLDSIGLADVLDFGSAPVDVDYRPDGLGEVAPSSASWWGEPIRFGFTYDRVLPGESSRFFYVRTDAMEYDAGGSIRLLRADLNASGAAWAYRPTLECQDGLDNDGDGLTDYGADPGCSSPGDSTEKAEPIRATGTIEIGGRGAESNSLLWVHLDSGGLELDEVEVDLSTSAGDVYYSTDTSHQHAAGGISAPYTGEVTTFPVPMDHGEQVFGFAAEDFDPGEHVYLTYPLPGAPRGGFACGVGCVFVGPSALAGALVTLHFSDGSAQVVTISGSPGYSGWEAEEPFDVPVNPLVCDDGFDNDGDGLPDHPLDPGCTSAWDLSELGPGGGGGGRGSCGLGSELPLLLPLLLFARRFSPQR